jgi:putative ABC transport system substrate-binding protein
MIDLVNRLWLGTLLIAAACAVLLVSDLDYRAAGPAAMPRIALIQHANTPPLDDGVRGLLEGLAARGYRDGETIAIQRFNAQADMTTAVAMARQATAGEYDLGRASPRS